VTGWLYVSWGSPTRTVNVPTAPAWRADAGGLTKSRSRPAGAAARLDALFGVMKIQTGNARSLYGGMESMSQESSMAVTSSGAWRKNDEKWVHARAWRLACGGSRFMTGFRGRVMSNHRRWGLTP